MPRPSKHTDEALIGAALELLPRTGVSGLKVRAVAARAGVNLGMFHYHFRNKREFARRVLAAFYGGFFSRLSGELAGLGEKSPRERLKRALIVIALFVRDNRGVVLSLLRDLIDGNKEVASFLRESFPRHAVILIGLIRECQKKGFIRPMPVPVVIAMLAPSVVGPAAGIGILERVASGTLLGIPLALFRSMLVSEKAFEERVEMVLKALALRQGRNNAMTGSSRPPREPGR
jgi:AcrR family transcriptional regulator